MIVCFNKVVLLQEEKANLLSEIDRLNERLNQADSLDDPRYVTVSFHFSYFRLYYFDVLHMVCWMELTYGIVVFQYQPLVEFLEAQVYLYMHCRLYSTGECGCV
jgi:hypothetical protein